MDIIKDSMNILEKSSFNKVFILFIFLIPMSIYIIGDFLGAGVQFMLFRIQTSYAGDSVIYLTNDLQYVFSGIYEGRSAFSILLWIAGVLICASAVLFTIFDASTHSVSRGITGLMIMISSVLFLISIIFQYGPYFHSPAGTAIPIGLPVMFIIGVWMIVERNNQES